MTSINLPSALIVELEHRAQRNGQDLAEAAADLIRKGLAVSPMVDNLTPPTLGVDPHTQLPVIDCQHEANPATEMTPARVAEILLEQESAWQHESR